MRVQNSFARLKRQSKPTNRPAAEEIRIRADAMFTKANDAVDTKALNLYRKALILYRELGANDKIAICLGNMGHIYNRMGCWADALQHGSLSPRAARAANSPRSLLGWGRRRSPRRCA